jgi:hypothetical protein
MSDWNKNDEGEMVARAAKQEAGWHTTRPSPHQEVSVKIPHHSYCCHKNCREVALYFINLLAPSILVVFRCWYAFVVCCNY